MKKDYHYMPTRNPKAQDFKEFAANVFERLAMLEHLRRMDELWHTRANQLLKLSHTKLKIRKK